MNEWLAIIRNAGARYREGNAFRRVMTVECGTVSLCADALLDAMEILENRESGSSAQPQTPTDSSVS
ncbi:MAG: hypothetical protein AAF662_11475 [Pseudomonadota bacterium]